MIKEHAICYTETITPEQMNYLIKKANRLGLQGREVFGVTTEKDAEGTHIFFETGDLKHG